jgi:hypothetical protein
MSSEVTPWRKGSEWTEADGRVLWYCPRDGGFYAVREKANNLDNSNYWMRLPQPPQGDE